MDSSRSYLKNTLGHKTYSNTNTSAKQLIEGLKQKGISNDNVLDAILNVPREKFISDALKLHAYSEQSLPIGFDQTISQPYSVAIMTQSILKHSQSKPKKILELGTGSGYQAAIFAYLGMRVYSVERIAALGFSAKKRFDALGIDRVSVKVANGALGWKDFAPYDAVCVTAVMKKIPKAVFEQMAQQSVLVAPIEEDNLKQNLYAFIKSEHKIVQKSLGPCEFVPFVNELK